MSKLSENQVETMMEACAVYPKWYRARGSGERVTLASLWRQSFLDRRTRRVGKSSADNAYEYRPTKKFVELARADGVMK
jgi:hypothetical protein